MPPLTNGDRGMTRPFRRIAAAFIAASALTCFAGAATAGESGSFTLLNSFVRDYTVLEHAGETITGGPLQGTATVIESSGGPFADGAHYRLTCVVYARRSDAGLDLEAPCTHTDREGDEWYVVAIRRAGDTEVGGGGQGVRRILGGMGKYAGVTGKCPYTTSYMPDDWAVSTAVCEWQKP